MMRIMARWMKAKTERMCHSKSQARRLLHLARMIKDAGGLPAHGNQRSAWDAGCRFDYANPDLIQFAIREGMVPMARGH